MRKLFVVLVGILCATPATGHDFWLQPDDFWVSPGSETPATLQVGHGQARQRSPIAADRITALRSIGPDGTVDQRTGLRLGGPDRDVELRLGGDGTHVVALETNDAVSNLPAARFNEYLQAEGLTQAIEWRSQTGTADEPGRELYSRRAKSIIQVGAPSSEPQPHVTEPAGLTLEIIPERNPYLLQPTERLPVRVIYEGQLLSGALVKLTDLNADEEPVETHLTDSQGHAEFNIPHSGPWLLNVVWTIPAFANRSADYVTVFSSLSFGSFDDAR